MNDANVKVIRLMNLIEFIHKNQELPKRQKDRDLFTFYTRIQQSAKIARDKQKEGIKITKTQTENLYYYMLVEDAISRYSLTKEQKLKLLLEFIQKKHRLPIVTTNNSKKKEETFSDGTGMRHFYEKFKELIKKLEKKQEQKKELTDQELIYLKYHRLINEELAKYKMTKQEKVEELIKFIYNNYRLPKEKQFNKGQSEALFRDETDMNRFYRTLKEKRNDILKNKMNKQKLTIKEQKIINYYDKIQEALCSVRMSKEEKEEELLSFIHKNHRLPKLGEVIYRDGKDMRNFYTVLEKNAKESIQKQTNNLPLTDIKQKNLECYNRVKATLFLYKMKPGEKTEINLDQIERIVECLELLGLTNSYEEMILLCETIIEKKDLKEEEEQKLRSVFQKYLERVYQLVEEPEKSLTKKL